MKLGVIDRLRLLELLAGQQGDLITLGVIRKINSKIEFTAEEYDLFGITQHPETGRVSWKSGPDIPEEVDVDLTEKQVEFVAKLLRKNRELDVGHVPLLEKFGVKIPDGEE